MKPLLLAAIVCVFAFTAQGMAASTPQQTVLAINEAVERGDTEDFQRLVDLDGLLQSAFDAFLQETRKPENADAIPPLLALALSAVEQNKPGARKILAGLMSEARAFVLNGIQTGAFGGKGQRSAPKNGLLAPLFMDISQGKKELLLRGYAPIRDQEDLLLPFIVHDYDNGNDYPVTGRFSPTSEGGLRLTGIANLEELFAIFQAEMKGGQ